MPTLKWSAETRVQAGFALALACIAVIAAASYLSLRRLTEDTARVARTDQVLAGLELLLSTATDGETAERGYVITGNGNSTRSVRSSRTEWPTSVPSSTSAGHGVSSLPSGKSSPAAARRSTTRSAD